MGNLGAGTGSGYPAALDYQSTPEVNSPSAGMTKARAAVPNDLAAAVIAIETELGTDPAGATTDVKTFLQVEHETDGTHGAITTASAITSTVATGTAPFVVASTTEVANLTSDIATNLAMTGEASATGTDTTTPIDFGTVAVGDRISVYATSAIAGTLPTYPYAAVVKSGTATVAWFHATTNPGIPLVATAAGVQEGSFAGVCKVTGAGTLVLTNTISYTGGSGLSFVNAMYAFFLKKA